MKQKINFQSPLHLACSNDSLKPALNYVYFQEGYAWATNGHILVRQSLSKFHNFDETQIEILNGKQLHKDVYKLILRHNFIRVRYEGIETLVSGGHEILFRWAKIPVNPPDHKAAIQNSVKHIEDVNKIGVNLKYLDIIGKILAPPSKEVRLSFTRENGAIFVSDNRIDIKDNFGLVMPVMIGGFSMTFDDINHRLDSIL